MMIFMSHFHYPDVPIFDAGGDCGVAFFFLLSGFVLSMGYGKKIDDKTFSFNRYFKRRLFKIFPLHLLCLVIFLIVFRPSIDHRLLLNVLLLQSWVPDGDYYFSYNAVSWFLSCLLFSYVVFPFAYRHANKRTLLVVLGCSIAAYVLIPYSKVNALLYVSPLIRFVDFFLGIMLYKVFSSRKGDLTNASFVELSLVVLLVMALIAYPYTDEKLRNAPLYWLVLLPIIYVFTQQQGVVSRCLQWQGLQWLGALSMPIFMTHPIVIHTMFHFFPSLPYAVLLAACFTITVALSWAIDHFYLRNSLFFCNFARIKPKQHSKQL